MADGAEQHPLDAVLLDSIRRGDQRATELMFERHVAYARAAAGRWAVDAAEREDLVSEAFARVLAAIQGGNGPSESFRPYLLVTIRNLAHSWTKRNRRVELHGEMPEQADTAGPRGLDELAVRRWESRTVWSAFWELPERWRLVLWYTEIEGIPPAKVAPLMGVTPRAVAALGLRAREGLRQAYLQSQVPPGKAPGCAAARRHLGPWLRGALPSRKTRLLERHLRDCADCRNLAASLSGDNGSLRRMSAIPAAAGQFTALGAYASKAAAVAIATALTVTGPPALPFTAAGPPVQESRTLADADIPPQPAPPAPVTTPAAPVTTKAAEGNPAAKPGKSDGGRGRAGAPGQAVASSKRAAPKGNPVASSHRATPSKAHR